MNFRQISAVHCFKSAQNVKFMPKYRFFLSTWYSTSSNKKEISAQSNPQAMKVTGSLTREQYLEFQARSKTIIATRWRRQLYLWLSGNFGLLARMFNYLFLQMSPNIVT